MSASKKGKKAVSQEELRRLMREKQKQSAEKKRVQSPFAKYSGSGQLSCGVCGVAVKSELLWPAHVLGKQHKEKVSALKDGRGQESRAPEVLPAPLQKRKAPQTDDGAVKKARAAASVSSSGRSAGLSLLAGVYEDEEDEEKAAGSADPPQQSELSELPADFFDSSIASIPASISHSGSIQKAEVPAAPPAEKMENMSEALPEGFFDDPVRDAKVRNVDAPKDQMDKEWEEFQKEIRQVNTKSEAIVAEDDEEGRLERQIDEIDEQIECYKRVELLRDRREVLARRRASTLLEDSMETEKAEEEEDDEELLLGLLSRDWRAKGALA